MIRCRRYLHLLRFRAFAHVDYVGAIYRYTVTPPLFVTDFSTISHIRPFTRCCVGIYVTTRFPSTPLRDSFYPVHDRVAVPTFYICHTGVTFYTRCLLRTTRTHFILSFAFVRCSLCCSPLFDFPHAHSPTTYVTVTYTLQFTWRLPFTLRVHLLIYSLRCSLR